jgi:hypothetical protein
MNRPITVTSSDGVEMTALIYARTDAQFRLAEQREQDWAAERTAAQLAEYDYVPAAEITPPRPPKLTLIQGGLDKYDSNTITIDDIWAPQPPKEVA